MRLSYWLQYSRKISCCCWCALQYSYIVRFFPIEKHTFAFKRKSTNRWEDPRSTVLPIGHVVGFGELVAHGARSGGAEEDHEWQKLRGMMEQFESLQSSIISYHRWSLTSCWHLRGEIHIKTLNDWTRWFLVSVFLKGKDKIYHQISFEFFCLKIFENF